MILGGKAYLMNSKIYESKRGAKKIGKYKIHSLGLLVALLPPFTLLIKMIAYFFIPFCRLPWLCMLRKKKLFISHPSVPPNIRKQHWNWKVSSVMKCFSEALTWLTTICIQPFVHVICYSKRLWMYVFVHIFLVDSPFQ